ncbi:MAG: VIT1/CCC1 transporter family protein [Patescibacteria group bacterium]
MSQTRLAKASYLRSFIFGVEDSLVSTVGLLSGIAMAGVARGTILTTGIILILVEAFSMAAGSFLSETSVEEYQGISPNRVPLIDGSIMFMSYVLAGLVPLVPYMYFETDIAFEISIGLALLALLVLGMFGGMYSNSAKKNVFRRGMRMLLIGGVAIVVGVVAGKITGF